MNTGKVLAGFPYPCKESWYS